MHSWPRGQVSAMLIALIQVGSFFIGQVLF